MHRLSNEFSSFFPDDMKIASKPHIQHISVHIFFISDKIAVMNTSSVIQMNLQIFGFCTMLSNEYFSFRICVSCVFATKFTFLSMMGVDSLPHMSFRIRLGDIEGNSCDVFQVGVVSDSLGYSIAVFFHGFQAICTQSHSTRIRWSAVLVSGNYWERLLLFVFSHLNQSSRDQQPGSSLTFELM